MANQILTLADAPVIWQEIEKAKNILLHLHPSPDGDSIGSTLAMSFALRSVGKNVTLIKGDSELPAYLSKLPGFDTIIPKNFFEIDLAAFDVFLILDSGSSNQISKLQEITFPLPMKTIVIDHHATNSGYGDINLIEPTYPATSQILFELFTKWGIKLTHDIALNLFAGIFTDTGGFRFRATTTRTYEIVAELTKYAPDFADFIFTMENSNTKSRLLLEGLLLTSIRTYCNNHLAIASIDNATIEKNDISHEDAGSMDVANSLKSVVGWNIGISLIEREPGIVKVSMRTRDPQNYDVSRLAVEIGGGGHAVAAGAQLPGTIQEAEAKIVAAAQKLYTF